MRILFVDQFGQLGGAQIGLCDIMREAQTRGWDSWFAAPGDGDLFAWCHSAGIATVSLPGGSYRNGSKTLADMGRYALDISGSARLINEIVLRNRIDLLYVNGPRILPAAIATGRPLIFHLHSALNKGYSRIIARWCLRRGQAAIISASRFVAEPLRDLPVRIVYNGVRDCGFVARPFTTRRIRVGIVGRISPEKGHLDFVQAAGMLSARGHNVEFVVVGAALFSDPAYEIKIRKAAAVAAVQFPGWTDDVASALHDIDILAAPCLGDECSPRILMEAFSAGTPVVAYPSGGIPEIVRHSRTGILTAQAKPKALADAIEKLIANRAQMAALSMNGRCEWDARFRVERFRNDIAESIERACHIESGEPQTSAAIAGEHYLPRAGAPGR